MHVSIIVCRDGKYSTSAEWYLCRNFVRHPVDRVVSWYYYIRAPTYQFREDRETNEYVYILRVALNDMYLIGSFNINSSYDW